MHVSEKTANDSECYARTAGFLSDLLVVLCFQLFAVSQLAYSMNQSQHSIPTIFVSGGQSMLVED
jgi:hypothetical protein